MTIDQNILDFLSELASADGYNPISDAKVPSLEDATGHVVIAEDDVIRAVGSIASHNDEEDVRVALETAVERSMRFPAFEKAVVEATTSLVPSNANVSVWSQRVSLDRALEELGYEAKRSLAYMTVDLPLRNAQGLPDHVFGLRTYTDEDSAAVVSVNNDAFSDHREASGLTMGEFAATTRSSWFEDSGLIIAEDEAGVNGFCWTRVHPDGDGEIYRIAVAPSHQGVGLGRVLVMAGFAHLADLKAVKRGTLWVDTASEGAIHLYRSIGMQTVRTNREFERAGQPKR
ncbi:MAG: GNAT family N-acetyltransferase [Actinomycetia bacterium]|nr:GNAT family N-acetyltransferase [Actinomycetes bacterium]